MSRLRHLVERLGPAPGSPAGRAVWCYYALGIEAALDRNNGGSPPWTGWSPACTARQEIAIADRLLQSTADAADPAGWAELCPCGAALRKHVRRTAAVRERRPTSSCTARAGQPRPFRQGWLPEQGEEPSL